METQELIKKGPTLGFVIGCLLRYNFHSFKRFLIYIFHYWGFLDLRIKSANQYSDKEIVDYLSRIYDEKVDKKILYSLLGVSKNTFNKHYKDFFEKNKFVGRRKFSLYEAYLILNEWQGEGAWSRLKSINKQEIADIINLGNLKNISSEFSLFNEDYKHKDKLSPKEVKEFLNHIDFDELEKEEELLQYKEFHNRTLWIFGISFVLKVLENSSR